MREHNELRVSQLSAIRGRREVFEGLSFAARSGEAVQVLGANGSGKSTLLRILAGLNPFDAGEIVWNDRTIQNNVCDFQERCVYLGHKDAVSDDASALENLDFFRDINAARAAGKSSEALSELGFDASVNTPTAHLSAGQRQRVALARLLVVESDLWLLDEPFTALDNAGKSLFEKLLRQHCDQGGSAIVATHQRLGLSHELVQDLTLA
ncbi:MAG: cytochrome c biogenesis heme-transporting ATPase CcmA [Pseudomonadota bacterium]